jgi:hypothetical protein
MGKIVVLSLAILCSKAVIKVFGGVCLGSALGKNKDINVHMVDSLVFESCHTLCWCSDMCLCPWCSSS